MVYFMMRNEGIGGYLFFVDSCVSLDNVFWSWLFLLIWNFIKLFVILIIYLKCLEIVLGLSISFWMGCCSFIYFLLFFFNWKKNVILVFFLYCIIMLYNFVVYRMLVFCYWNFCCMIGNINFRLDIWFNLIIVILLF